jgi:thiol-disulfide isomerase/thioredoxin
MGFNLKEKLQNISRKNVIIATVILLIVTILAVAGYEYYNYTKLKAKAEEAVQKAFEEAAPDLSGEPKKPSEYQIGEEYNKAMKSKKPVLVLFYADWCGYCVRFMPVYQAISEKYNDTFDFSKVNVEDKKYEKVVRTIGLTGFPTVFIIDPKYDNKVLLSNTVLGTVDDLSVEMDRYNRIRKLLDSKK